MDTEQPRELFAIGGLAGAAVFGLHALVTSWIAGQTPTRQDLIRAGVNVVAAMFVGGVTAYFLGPVIATYLPIQLRDALAIGFAIGLLGWEGLPLALRFFQAKAEKAVEKASGDEESK